jgi:hypothetical protein
MTNNNNIKKLNQAYQNVKRLCQGLLHGNTVSAGHTARQGELVQVATNTNPHGQWFQQPVLGKIERILQVPTLGRRCRRRHRVQINLVVLAHNILEEGVERFIVVGTHWPHSQPAPGSQTTQPKQPKNTENILA